MRGDGGGREGKRAKVTFFCNCKIKMGGKYAQDSTRRFENMDVPLFFFDFFFLIRQALGKIKLVESCFFPFPPRCGRAEERRSYWLLYLNFHLLSENLILILSTPPLSPSPLPLFFIPTSTPPFPPKSIYTIHPSLSFLLFFLFLFVFGRASEDGGGGRGGSGWGW